MDRKRSFDGWCGVTDAVMQLLPPNSRAAPALSEARSVGESSEPHVQNLGKPVEQFANSSAAPERPRKAGCYVWLPDGCRKQHFRAKLHWRHDTWGERNVQARESEDACVARKKDFDMWCGVRNAVMLRVAPSDQDIVGGLGGDAPAETWEAEDQFEEGQRQGPSRTYE
jgi:hypothetical protein